MVKRVFAALNRNGLNRISNLKLLIQIRRLVVRLDILKHHLKFFHSIPAFKKNNLSHGS